MARSPFMAQVRCVIRVQQKAFATEKTYCYWIYQFIRFRGYQSPDEIFAADVTRINMAKVIDFESHETSLTFYPRLF